MANNLPFSPASSSGLSTISVLGCGWLGLPLAASLASRGYRVRGSTTSPAKLEQLAEQRVKPYLLRFDPQPFGEPLGDFLRTDLLIVAIPPRVEARGEAFHGQQIEHLAEHLRGSSVTRLIYISSTSVYPDLNRVVTEEERLPQSGSNTALLRAEALLQTLSPTVQTTVLRCGGLMGYNRIPGRYFAGRTVVNGQTPVNFIHRDDVIGIVHALLQQPLTTEEVYNVVAPEHPSRQEIYMRNAAEFGFTPPHFAPQPNAPFKIVSVEKLLRATQYAFRYPNPLFFPYTLG